MTNPGNPIPAAPIFVIGNPRSGTTMLRLMLTCHPEIAIPPEGGFLVSLHAKYKGFAGEQDSIEAFAGEVVALHKMEEWGLSSGDLAEYLVERRPRNYPELAAGVYEHYARLHQPGGTRWGDKNNFYLNHIETLAGLYPAAKFLHIVRDGRDVACSYRDLAMVGGKYAPNLSNSVLGSARQWRRNLSTVRRSFDRVGRSRVQELRYEDLVADPEGTLEEVCRFLGEDYSSEMLTFGEQNRSRNLEPKTYDPWKGQTRQDLSASRAERWRTSMFAEDLVLFEAEAGSALRDYEYPITSSKQNRTMRSLGAFYSVGSRLSELARPLRPLAAKTYRAAREVLSKA